MTAILNKPEYPLTKHNLIRIGLALAYLDQCKNKQELKKEIDKIYKNDEALATKYNITE